MDLVLSLLFIALTVKEDNPLLKGGCGPDAGVVQTLPAGTQLTIRYGLPGESTPCYKVAAQSGQITVEGYLPASAIAGLDSFETGRRGAAWLDTQQTMGAVRESKVMPSLSPGANAQGFISQLAGLIESGQPKKALELIEPELSKRTDPIMLALAGIAAWHADDSRKALAYLRQSLDLSPNPEVERIYRQVERENKGDQSSEKLYGLRVVLRYDPGTIPVEAARQMVASVDDEFFRISSQLGCSAEEKITVIIQSPEAYRKTTDAAEWNNGQFDGRIRVPVTDRLGLDPNIRKALAHETTHACLAMLGRWPAWLHEGLAQRFTGDTATPEARRAAADLVRQGKVPRLSNMRQDWSRMDTEHALAAYALSLAAVDLLYENYHDYGVRNLLHNPGQLGAITADLDKRLGL